MTRSRAMTLIEMLFVIAAIAVLASILFPVFARARESARKHSCLGNLVNIGVALQMYAEDQGGRFPPTEDDLSSLAARYLRQPIVFLCPSQSERVPMGGPANPKLRTYAPDSSASLATGPHGKLLTNYYYRARHRLNEAPSPLLLSDQNTVHSDHANVLYADGHAGSPGAAAWQALGFTPIDKLVTPPTPPPGAGMPGMGGGGPPGGPGMPPGAPAGGQKP